jgi:hypothetical protein
VLASPNEIILGKTDSVIVHLNVNSPLCYEFYSTTSHAPHLAHSRSPWGWAGPAAAKERWWWSVGRGGRWRRHRVRGGVAAVPEEKEEVERRPGATVRGLIRPIVLCKNVKTHECHCSGLTHSFFLFVVTQIFCSECLRRVMIHRVPKTGLKIGSNAEILLPVIIQPPSCTKLIDRGHSFRSMSCCFLPRFIIVIDSTWML